MPCTASDEEHFAVQHRTASSLFVSGTRRRGAHAQGGRTHYLPELLQDICRLQLEGDLFQGGSQMACTMAMDSSRFIRRNAYAYAKAIRL